MKVNKEVRKISSEFHKQGYSLYLVGGYVRNSLMNLTSTDLDITSNMPVEEVIKLCDNLGAKCKSINRRLGSIQITYNNTTLEYTQFRKESYSSNKEHTPNQVDFVEDIATDVLRRDFTINSIYYDIHKSQIVDLVGGVKDIARRSLRTPRDPYETLSDDGLRILRGIRFANTYGLKISRKTYKCMQIYSPLLRSISKERILSELEKIVVSDLSYNISSPTFVSMLNDCNVYKYIFGLTNENRLPKISRKLEKSIYTLPSQCRLIGLLVAIIISIVREDIPHNQLSYIIETTLGIDGLKASRNTISIVEKLSLIISNLNHDKDITNASINYLTMSDSERLIVESFVTKQGNSRLDNTIEFVKANNLPLSIHQLDISAQEIIDLNIDSKYVSKILSTLYNQVLNMSVPNNKIHLGKLAIDINNTFKKTKGDRT